MHGYLCTQSVFLSYHFSFLPVEDDALGADERTQLEQARDKTLQAEIRAQEIETVQLERMYVCIHVDLQLIKPRLHECMLARRWFMYV